MMPHRETGKGYYCSQERCAVVLPYPLDGTVTVTRERITQWIGHQGVVPPVLLDSVEHDNDHGRHDKQYGTLETLFTCKKGGYVTECVAQHDAEDIPVAVPDRVPTNERPAALTKCHVNAEHKIQCNEHQYGHIHIKYRC